MKKNERTICKGCGFKRTSWEDMLDQNICPNCKEKYSVVNNDSKYIPNKIPLKHRVTSILLAISIFSYCIYSLKTGEITLFFSSNTQYPARAILDNFSGIALIPAVLSGLMAVALSLVVVINHYDKRNNEYKYRKMAASFSLLMKLFFLISLFIKYSEKLYN